MNTTANADPLAGVSSLYGPGTLLAWACTAVSVFINWNINPDVRNADTLTNDFLAALAIPAIAAGHVFYLILYQDATAAIVQAPLRACMGFIVVIHCLEIMPAQRRQPKRLACCLFTGLLVFVGQVPALVCTGWVEKVEARQSGIFLFSFVFLTAAWGVGIWQMSIIVAISLNGTFGRTGVGQLELVATAAGEDPRPGFACAQHWRVEKRHESCEMCREEGEVVRWAQRQETGRLLTTVAVGCPSAFLGVWGVCSFAIGGVITLAPESPYSILDLDQGVALLLGLVTVGSTMRDAFQSRRDGRCTNDNIDKPDEIAKGILDMYSAPELDSLVYHMPRSQSLAGSRGRLGWLREKGDWILLHLLR